MKATFISRENNDVKFTMDFTAEEFEGAVEKAYKSNKGRFTINGFRKGKAPRGIIEKHYGEGIFFEDAVNDLFQNYYLKAVHQLDLDVIGSPSAEFSDIGKGSPFTVTLSVPVYPIIDVKDYIGVEVEQAAEKIKEEDVAREIEALRERNSRMVVAERPVRAGDMIVLDYTGSMDGKPFEGGTAENQEIVIGSGIFLPGFEEQLIGAEKEKEKEVRATFPEDYHIKDIAGKEAVFRCVIHDIKEKQLPELDDEFAKDVSEYDTLDELKKSTGEKLQEYANVLAENSAKEAVINKIYEANKIEPPKSMIENEIDEMLEKHERQLRMQGISLSRYMDITGKDMEGVRNSLREKANREAAIKIILSSIALAENIRVTDRELEEKIAGMAESCGMTIQKVREMIGEEDMVPFTKQIRLQKTVDMLYDRAVIIKPAEKAGDGEGPGENDKNQDK